MRGTVAKRLRRRAYTLVHDASAARTPRMALSGSGSLIRLSVKVDPRAVETMYRELKRRYV